MKLKPLLPVVLLLAAMGAGLLGVAGCGGEAGSVAAPPAHPTSATPPPEAPPAAPLARDDFLGSKSCRDCHEEFYKKWAGSWHGLAMRQANAESVRRQLRPQDKPIAVGPRTYQAQSRGQDWVVVENGPDGRKQYPVAYVMGGKNVLFLLTPLDRGRLQVLPAAYDVRKNEWYDTTGSMVRHFDALGDAPLEWTDRQLTFNASCHNCHVSQLSKNYDLATDTYRTVWREEGIGCEACHGPGRKHAETMTATPGKSGAPLELITMRGFNHAQVNAACGQCHAKRSSLTAAFVPGEPFFDHFHLTTLEDPDFYPDGRELGEDFTHTAWLMSPCAASGELDCLHCHTSSGRDKHAAQPDNACLPCHAKIVADAAAHSRHAAGTEGARCIACHMPKTSFARMQRHDHSMRSPSPAATQRFGSPNACNLCHADKDAAWADQWVRKWYPRDYQAAELHRGGLVAAARNADWTRGAEMLRYLAQKDANEVFAASLLRLMARWPSAEKWPAYLAALKHPSPLVRASAAAGLDACETAEATRALADAAADSSRGVRVEAARVLARRPANELPEARRAEVAAALREFEAALRCEPDSPTSHYNLGNYALDRGEAAEAVAEFRIAAKLAPTFIPTWVNLAMAEARRRNAVEAENALRTALKHQPANPEANFNLGLLLGDSKPGEAESCFRTALKSDPQFAQAAHALAELVAGRDLAEAIRLQRQAVALRPDAAEVHLALAAYLARSGQRDEAVTTLRSWLAKHPQDRVVREFLDALLEKR